MVSIFWYFKQPKPPVSCSWRIVLTYVATTRPLPVSQSLPSPSPVACACNGGSGTRSSPAAESFSFAACLLLFLKLLLGLVWFDFGFGLVWIVLVRVWLQLHWHEHPRQREGDGKQSEFGLEIQIYSSTMGYSVSDIFFYNGKESFKYILLQWEIEFQIYSSTMGNRVYKEGCNGESPLHIWKEFDNLISSYILVWWSLPSHIPPIQIILSSNTIFPPLKV